MESQTLVHSTSNTLEDDYSNIDYPAVPLNPPAKSLFSILEPPVFLLFFASSLSGTVFQSQIIYQSCTEIFHFNKTECLLLGTENATNATEAMEKTIQPYAGNIFMARTIVESILPAVINLFIGPWSDRFGRKPLIMSTFVGYFIMYVLITVISYVSTVVSVNPWFYLLPFIPVSICGGNCALITGAFSYVADLVANENRAMRMANLEAALFAGLLIGSMSSSYLLEWTSTTAIFGISATAAFLGVLYVIFLIGESIQQDESISKLEKFRAIFDLSLATDMIQTCFKRRENYVRSILWTTITTLVLSIFVMEGSATVFYLFVRDEFDWTIHQSTFFDAANILVMILGNVVGMYILNKVLGVSETTLAIISYFSSVVDYVIKIFAVQSWHLYLATGVSFLRGIAGPLCRSILSNVVPAPNEIGKIYSLTTSLESISPLGSAPLYNFVYSHTLDRFPGAFNVISAGLYSINFALLVIVYIFLRRYPPVDYETVDQ